MLITEPSIRLLLTIKFKRRKVTITMRLKLKTLELVSQMGLTV